MKSLFLSYGIYEYDGRMRELISISKSIGETKYITRAGFKGSKQEVNHEIILGEGFFNYFKFIIKCLSMAFKMEEIDILFIDNRKAIIPGIIIRLLKRPRYMIQDVRELYLIDEVNHLSGKIGCIFEQYLFKRADVIICANEYRANIMKNYFNLVNKPLVYENIRSLEYTGETSIEDIDNRYNHYFNKNTIKIISTSGCNINRTNDILVKAMVELGENYELFLIGGGTENDIQTIKDIIEINNLRNVHLIDRLNTDELKYFLQKSEIGIVNYHQCDTNNKYCASGKVYEYLFEKIPVVTTENIPLIELCDKHKIGVYDNNYVDAIRELGNNYSYYKENVRKYIAKLDVKKHNAILIKELKKIIKA